MSNFSDICSYTFYFLLNVMTYSIMMSLNDNFFKDFPIYYHFLLFSMSIIAYILLIITKNNPGEIINNKYSEIRKILSNDIVINIPESIENNEFKENKISLIDCGKCTFCNNEVLPLRSHHCSRCNKCIKFYDHHCGMIGGCIGENNHFKFILFLFFQSLALFIGIFGLLETLQNLIIRKKKQKPVTIYFLIFVLFFYGIFTLVLFLFHIYLVMTNQSTFEIYHPEKCDYLRKFTEEKKKIFKERNIFIDYSYTFHPFDMGIKENIKFVIRKFLNPKEKIDWEEIYYKNLYSNKIPFNFCENEYWSCF